MLESLIKPWLALHCHALMGVRSGMVVLRPGAGPPVVAARWPAEAGPPAEGPSGLGAVAVAALEGGKPTVRGSRDPSSGPAAISFIAVPFTSGELSGAVAVEVIHAGRRDSQPSCKSVVEDLGRGVAWLQRLAGEARTQARLARILDVVAAGLECADPREAATSVVAALAKQLGCERVSAGTTGGRSMKVLALSTAADFDARSQMIQDIERAMEEAADQDRTVVRPEATSDATTVGLAADALRRAHGAGAVCCVPLPCRSKVIGALSFEHENPASFDRDTVAFLEGSALLIGPLLEAQRKAGEGVFARLRGKFRDGWKGLREPGNSGRKLVAAAVALAVVAPCVFSGTYRVGADATLEGRTQRAVVAGFEGFIAEARARAGDVVSAGQLLATLDSKDLLLEQRQRQGKRAQLEREYREALSVHDRARASVVRAQIEQADAQSALVDEQIARSELRAPFDGVIVRGDLSQSLGSPVERGDLLFEIAPLDGYRIILAVDERDIADVAVGQPGELTLSALPDHPLPLTVERIIPISFDQDGRNAFRVEATLETPVAGLRPGMEGVGKVEIESRRWIWIWTHELVGWLRVWAWSWWP